MLRDFRERNKYITYRNLAILALTISFAFNICLYMKTRSIQNEMDDWASLSSYSVSNAVLSHQAPGRVVFMGDSITYYWDFAGYFPGKPYVNRGISGQTTPQMLVRFRQDVVDLQPDVVVILGGTNDLADLTGYQPPRIIEGNLLSMADLARENGITVILASILPVCGDYVTERPPRLINEINAFIKSYCEKNDIIYLDYHSALVGEDGLLRPELSAGCLHLNGEGYKMLAPLVEEAIEQAFGQREENLVVD